MAHSNQQNVEELPLSQHQAEDLRRPSSFSFYSLGSPEPPCINSDFPDGNTHGEALRTHGKRETRQKDKEREDPDIPVSQLSPAFQLPLTRHLTCECAILEFQFSQAPRSILYNKTVITVTVPSGCSVSCSSELQKLKGVGTPKFIAK